MSSDTNILSKYDDFLRDEADIAAIVIRERLRPVQGPRGVFFYSGPWISDQPIS